VNLIWHSNSAFTPSGYGGQTALFTRLLNEAGHNVIISTFYGLKGAELTINGVRHLPGGIEPWGNDLLPLHYEAFRPDVMVALVDAWVLQPETLARVPITSWAPIDHDPAPPAVIDRLRRCAHVWAMSRHGEREMRRAGLDPAYVPHGVDCDVFRPLDRAMARSRLEIDEDTFFAVCVAANKGWPSRKALDRLFKAWARFAARHPSALLYVHTYPGDDYGGPNLIELAQFYGIPERNLRFPDVYRLLRGSYGPTELNLLYNAADVMVLPSAGGGFEIPLIEAQAAGCPVITTRVTAMAELIGPGYGLHIDPFDGLAYTEQGSEQANVLPSQILDGLEWAIERRGDETLRADSRAFALDYDGRRVLREFMLPALEAQKEMAALP
jgi:glycosyltransferase involved in cell wall biosynthesis